MGRGLTPQKALETMQAVDKDRETRQVIIIDSNGGTAAFTGKEAVAWKGHILGNEYIAAGNMLVSKRVIEAMGHSFERGKGSLAKRLLRALEVGQNAGGDKRGRMSAALLVADNAWAGSGRPLVDLRVDAHSNLVEELQRVYAVARSYFHVSK